jgi:DNA repair photolyase
MSRQPIVFKGRGATLNPQGRFEKLGREDFDDGWAPPAPGDEPAAPKTEVTPREVKTIISRNDSPDIPFSQSINPYWGCEHGCAYCYARPSYAYWGMSPGLDFETRLVAKTNAAKLLREELAHPRYRCEPITLGANTDCYQPIEREWRITRQVLEVLHECRHPVGIITKSALVERDIDLLADMARDGLAEVWLSVTSLDGELARRLEPRAAAPHRRLQTIAALAAAGIPVGVMVAPIIPALNDKHIEAVLEAAHHAGARRAGMVMLRLPNELKELFEDWLRQHYPMRAGHVLSLVRQLHGAERGSEDEAKLNDPRFGHRMRGEGIFAELVAQRFKKACGRLGLNRGERNAREVGHLVTGLFRPPAGPQMDLF